MRGPRRLYLDLDMGCKEQDDIFALGVAQGAIRSLTACIAHVFGIEINPGSAVIVDSGRATSNGKGYKHSYHISFSHLVFDEQKVMETFTKEHAIPWIRHENPILDRNIKWLDDCVYSHERAWRLVGSSKVGGGVEAALRLLGTSPADAWSAEAFHRSRCAGLSEDEIENAHRVALATTETLRGPDHLTWVCRPPHNDQFPCVLAREEGDKYFYRGFRTREGAAAYVDSYDENEPRHLHTVATTTCRLVFDIEWDDPNAVDEPMETLLCIHKKVRKLLRKRFGVNVEAQHGGLATASRGKKHSYHLHYGRSFGFESIAAQRHFVMKLLIPKLPVAVGKRIDTAIYRNHGCLRLVGSGKRGRPGSVMREATSDGYGTIDWLMGPCAGADRIIRMDEMAVTVPIERPLDWLFQSQRKRHKGSRDDIPKITALLRKHGDATSTIVKIVDNEKGGYDAGGIGRYVGEKHVARAEVLV